MIGILNSFKYENEKVEILDSNSYGYTVKLKSGKVLDGIKRSAITLIEKKNNEENNDIIIIEKCGEYIYVDKNTHKILYVRINNRNYKASRYINNFYYKSIVKEYFNRE